MVEESRDVERETEKDRIEKNKTFGRGIVTGMLGTWFIGILALAYCSPSDNVYNVPQCPSSVLNYDVDGDGLDDFVERNGNVLIQQGDGSYVSLGEHARNLSREIKDSYKLQECEDGLYRTVGSGCVSQAEKGLIGSSE